MVRLTWFWRLLVKPVKGGDPGTSQGMESGSMRRLLKPRPTSNTPMVHKGNVPSTCKAHFPQLSGAAVNAPMTNTRRA